MSEVYINLLYNCSEIIGLLKNVNSFVLIVLNDSYVIGIVIYFQCIILAFLFIKANS